MVPTLFENWLLKLISLAFAVVLWFFVMGERKLEVPYIVPLEYKNLPQELMIANETPSSVDVRISGPRALLMNLSPDDISISVDLEDLQAGMTSFKRLEESLNIPSGLKATRVSPSFVDVKLDQVREKTVPVEVLLAGAPARGYRVASTRVDPNRVVVSGAESELKTVSLLVTEDVSLDGVQESFSQTVAINYIGNYTGLKENKTVEVHVLLEKDPEYVEEPQPIEDVNADE